MPGEAVMRLVELCTASGMQTRLLPAMPSALGERGGGHPGQPDPHPGDACGYCALAVPPPLVLLSARLPWVTAAVAPVFRRYTPASRSLRNLRGLGAQAPPLPL
jgi:hypothetical protein